MNTNETDTKVETDGVMKTGNGIAWNNHNAITFPDQIPVLPVMEKWTVWSLDVWGNDDDGFEVNDRSRRATIELPFNNTGEQILAALIDCGAIKESVTLPQIDILDYWEDHMEIEDASNGYPLYHLERCEA